MSDTAIIPVTANGVTHHQPQQPRPVPGGTSCPSLSAALAAARDRCKAASKDGTNSFHRYQYATADEVIATACDALQGSGLAIIPVSEELTVMAAGPRSFYALNRTLVLSHASGEFLPLEVRGWPVVEEKGRPLDKAYAVALTTSLSYKLRDLLQMPRGDQFGDDMNQRDDRDHKPAPPPRLTVRQAAQKLDADVVEGDIGAGEVVTPEQAQELEAFLDAVWLKPDDFLRAFDLQQTEDMEAGIYPVAFSALTTLKGIRTRAEKLGVTLNRILSRYPDATCLFDLSHEQLLEVSRSLDKTAKRQQEQQHVTQGA